MNVKKVVVIMIIAIIMGIAIGVVFNTVFKNDKNASKDNNDSTLLQEEKDAKELFYNNYLISYILDGDISVSENSVLDNNQKYYAVDDELLKELHSVEEIVNLIKNNITEDRVSQVLQKLSDENSNKYISFNNTLYVLKTSNPCEYKLYNADEITYWHEKDNLFIQNSYIGGAAIKENDEWRFPILLFSCHISKED